MGKKTIATYACAGLLAVGFILVNSGAVSIDDFTSLVEFCFLMVGPAAAAALRYKVGESMKGTLKSVSLLFPPVCAVYCLFSFIYFARRSTNDFISDKQARAFGVEAAGYFFFTLGEAAAAALSFL